MAKARGLAGKLVLTRADDADTIASTPADPASDSAGITPQPRTSIVAALRAGGLLDETSLDLIAEHPENPREQFGDFSDLVASIRSVGLLQPIVITSSAGWLAERPQDAAKIGDLPYVVLAGHRRVAAAKELGLPSLPAIVRDDLSNVASSAAAFLHENITRRDLSPLEEARGYQLLVEIGRSQRDIATDFGRGQSHISKRLALLSLSPRLQDEIREGRLSLVNANVLAAVPVEDQEMVHELAQQRKLPIEQAHRHLERDRETARTVAQATSAASEEGTELVDPAAEFGDAIAQHRLYDVRAIEAARKSGTLVGHASPRGLEYYSRIIDSPTTTPPPPTDSTSPPPSSGAPTPVVPENTPDSRRDDRERRTASKRRIEAAGDLVQSLPSAATVRTDLVRAILRGIDSSAVKLAHQWLGSTIGELTANPAEWRESLIGTNHESHAAWAIAVATYEVVTRAAQDEWPEAAIEWVQRLVLEAAYAPTEWEKRRIDEGDSNGITVPSHETRVPE